MAWSKTDAADALGLEIALYAKENGLEVNRELVEARFSEAHYSSTEMHQAVVKARPHWKTTLRAALRHAS